MHSAPENIIIKGARLHNLKNITVQIPKYKLVVVTGLSGSGKSTLAFDTLHKEGTRQYMMSLGMVTDYMSKPDYDSITGLSPSISVDQHLSNRSPRSTVGTATEVYTYLRVLFARMGSRPCPICHQIVPPSHNLFGDESWQNDEETGATFPCPHCGSPIPELGMADFSFNKPAGACPTCTGLGISLDANLDTLLDETKSILDGGVPHWDKHEIARYSGTLANAGRYFGFQIDPAAPITDFNSVQRDLFLYGVHHPRFRSHFPEIEPPETVANGRFEGLVTNLLRRYQEHADNPKYRARLDKYLVQKICPECEGARLRSESRQVQIGGQTIIELSQLTFGDLLAWLEKLPETITDEEKHIVEPVIDDLLDRVQRLVDVGVGYLSMARGTPSISAGEAQRLRLASLLGSGLTGVLYVLDEPTIGLHQNDTARLINVLRRLRDLGNTVLVVEHDLDVMRAADYLIDIGPGAGRHGGKVVASGEPAEVAAHPSSITGKYLSGSADHPKYSRCQADGRALIIHGARAHNLKNITAAFPVGLLTGVSGLSGSGKSSLVLDILDRAARRKFYRAGDDPGAHDRISGWEHFDEVITIDQTPIGRNPRSNPATYSDAFVGIRKVFADQDGAKQAGLPASHFSFNVPGGRCERCKGSGELTINMHFLPDVPVRCPECRGKRFQEPVLEVTYKGKHITQVLDLTVEEAGKIFADIPAIAKRLALMSDVGLGYLKLGQPATTLSGGEAQRVKLAKELGRRSAGRTLYLFDEPTTGLHPADTTRLLTVLQRLVDAGNTVVVIEHNLDILHAADWIVDLGPEGGQAGGQIIAQGPPEQIKGTPRSYTGAYI